MTLRTKFMSSKSPPICQNSVSQTYIPPYLCWTWIRVLSRFFDPLGHENVQASRGNKHFSLNNFTSDIPKLLQSKQKLGAF